MKILLKPIASFLIASVLYTTSFPVWGAAAPRGGGAHSASPSEHDKQQEADRKLEEVGGLIERIVESSVHVAAENPKSVAAAATVARQLEGGSGSSPRPLPPDSTGKMECAARRVQEIGPFTVVPASRAESVERQMAKGESEAGIEAQSVQGGVNLRLHIDGRVGAPVHVPADVVAQITGIREEMEGRFAAQAREIARLMAEVERLRGIVEDPDPSRRRSSSSQAGGASSPRSAGSDESAHGGQMVLHDGRGTHAGSARFDWYDFVVENVKNLVLVALVSFADFAIEGRILRAPIGAQTEFIQFVIASIRTAVGVVGHNLVVLSAFGIRRIYDACFRRRQTQPSRDRDDRVFVPPAHRSLNLSYVHGAMRPADL